MKNTLRGVGLLTAATLPFGIVVHLLAEAVAVGHAGINREFFSRHAYLLVLAVAGAFILTRFLRPYCRAQAGFLTTAFVKALPYRGRGYRFFAVVWLLQIGFCGVTLVGERGAVHAADWCLGSVIAVAVASVTSLVIEMLPRSLVRIIAVLHLRRDLHAPLLARGRRRQSFALPALLHTGYAAIVGNRPPPTYSR